MSAIGVTSVSSQGRESGNIPSALFSQKRYVFLTGEITVESAEDIVQQLLYLDGSGSGEITLWINSPGGDVSAGFAIYDTMQNCVNPVGTLCCGMAASMAAFLLAAGEPGRRRITPHSEVMIHQVLGGTQGQATDIQIAARHIEKVKQTLNRLMSAHTGQPLDRICADVERNYYMSASEAVSYGMADSLHKKGKRWL